MEALEVEKSIAEGEPALQGLIKSAREHAGKLEAHEAEKGIFKRLLPIGLAAMQLSFAERGPGDSDRPSVGPTACSWHGRNRWEPCVQVLGVACRLLPRLSWSISARRASLVAATSVTCRCSRVICCCSSLTNASSRSRLNEARYSSIILAGKIAPRSLNHKPAANQLYHIDIPPKSDLASRWTC
jgi:hypothetical protein